MSEPRPPTLAAHDLESLCKGCGLCCDGSLFGRVTLQPDEVVVAKKGGLRVITTGKGFGGPKPAGLRPPIENAFEQPCSALVTAARGAEQHVACSIYDGRPEACRRFVCRLHDRFRREGGPLEPRLASVSRVRRLLRVLEASGVEPADFEANRVEDRPGDESLQAAYVELMRRLEEDFARA
jgi:hypothetical protein